MEPIDVKLIVDEQETPVTAELEAFGPRRNQWSGTLHDVPTEMIPAMHQSESVRLRLPNGEERTIWPDEDTYLHEAETDSVPFSGDGLPPF